MKLLFMGTSDFACPSLHKLAESSHEIVGVVTQQDKPQGRNRLHPVKVEAQKLGLPIYQPEKVNRPEAREWIADSGAELVVVAAYGQILRKKLLAIPPRGFINVHGSLLPRHRGAAPVNYAVLAGDTITGVTIQKVVRKLDAGPIIVQRETAIEPDETAAELYLRLKDLGADALIEAIDLIDNDEAEYIEQNHDAATFAPSLQRKDGRIDWNQPAEQLKNFVRGMTTWPGAWTYFEREEKKNLRAVISRSEIEKGDETPGVVSSIDGGRLLVGTAEGLLEILEITPAAGKRLSGRDFINGYQIEVGQRFLGRNE